MTEHAVRCDECGGPGDRVYEDLSDRHFGGGGGWAIAYLMNKYGEDVLLKSFHPRVEKLGWEEAFKQTFGQSSPAFAAEFERFMDLPLSEQVKVLPEL